MCKQCASDVQDQYKYCFKVLWDYSKCKKRKPAADHRGQNAQRRPVQTASSKYTDSSSTMTITSRYSDDQKPSSMYAGVSRTIGRSFATALAVQNVRTGGGNPSSTPSALDVERGFNMSYIE